MQMSVATLCVQADDPSVAGHFPGKPLVPAVVILDAVLSEARRQRPGLTATCIQHAKFPRPMQPGASVELHLECRDTRLHFAVSANGVTHASGTVAFNVELPA